MGITNTNVVNMIRDTLESLETEVGAEVSDERDYRVEVSWAQIPRTDLIAITLDFPRSIIGGSEESARLAVKHFNEEGNDYELQLVASGSGVNVSYEGIPDWAYFRQILMVRIEEKS